MHNIGKQHTSLLGRQNHNARPEVTSQGTQWLSAGIWEKRKEEVQVYQHPICHEGMSLKVSPGGRDVKSIPCSYIPQLILLMFSWLPTVWQII